MRRASRRICKCHGVSGSCAMRSCYNVLLPFRHTARAIHRMYQNPERVTPASINTIATSSVSTTRPNVQQLKSSDRRHHSRRRKEPRHLTLWITEYSPDFCTRSRFSYGTAGRKCFVQSPWKRRRENGEVNDAGSRDTLCCFKGHALARYEEGMPKRCECVYSGFRVVCTPCKQKEMHYYCSS